MRLSKVRDRQRAVYRLQTFSLKNIDQVIQANFPKWRTVSSSCVAVSSEWKHYLQEGGERCNKTPEANKTEKAQKAHESYKIHKAPSQACKSWGIGTLPPASCAGSPAPAVQGAPQHSFPELSSIWEWVLEWQLCGSHAPISNFNRFTGPPN